MEEMEDGLDCETPPASVNGGEFTHPNRLDINSTSSLLQVGSQARNVKYYGSLSDVAVVGDDDDIGSTSEGEGGRDSGLGYTQYSSQPSSSASWSRRQWQVLVV